MKLYSSLSVQPVIFIWAAPHETVFILVFYNTTQGSDMDEAEISR